MDRPKLTNPLVQVLMEDGATWDVQSRHVDLMQAELEQARRGMPGPDKAAVNWLTFVAFYASRREGHIPGSLKFDQFVARAMQIGAPSADEQTEQEAAEVPFTEPDPAPD